jgi:hypothetical protein
MLFLLLSELAQPMQQLRAGHDSDEAAARDQ